MDAGQVQVFAEFLRTFGSEDASIEARRAASKLPESVIETLSAFANTPEGGVLLLGVDESEGFAVTGVSEATEMQSDLAAAARDRLSPPPGRGTKNARYRLTDKALQREIFDVE